MPWEYVLRPYPETTMQRKDGIEEDEDEAEFGRAWKGIRVPLSYPVVP